ncbi:DUF3180 domain-containing protein [Nesterenkonia marinintestina]|uniref:DUF3180 domain-containing protein n=1 Tax=Nesterenkonia marinintestina TaxID=2979865 RepID=UPI0021C01900|nr:DUF3180 domain-containing protein [Nesterenkonia sp. GX14115]
MTRLRPLWLLALSAGAVVLGLVAAVVMAGAGYGAPVLPNSALVTLIGVGAVILTLGIVVRRDMARLEAAARREREREARRDAGGAEEPRGPRPARRVSPLFAVRVVAAAQSAAYAGTIILGWHLGILAHLAPQVGLGTANAQSAVYMAAGGLGWVIVGFVVEHLCRLPPDDGAGAASRHCERGRPDAGRRGEEGYARGTD